MVGRLQRIKGMDEKKCKESTECNYSCPVSKFFSSSFSGDVNVSLTLNVKVVEFKHKVRNGKFNGICSENL
jgi:hypothetical protein